MASASASAPPTPFCLPAVLAEEGRVIRTLAGIRPYRDAGFVVREETLGTKRLVHNYGHGGAGITLSWGSSMLATRAGLGGHSGPVAVIGSGALGLTTAKLVQEAGFKVTIYAADFPPDTTSNVSGGQIHPASLFRDSAVSDSWIAQFAAAMDYSYRRFQISVGEDTGVRWLTTYDETRGRGLPEIETRMMPAARILSEGEHPFPVETVREWRGMYVETGRWLEHLMREVAIAGGRMIRRRFDTPADLAELPETLIINCTGFGARDLFGDQEMVGARGQLAILLPQPELNYAYRMRAGYMFPRPDGVILGGTFERGVTDPTAQPEDIARILSAHRELSSAFACST
ncbi:FAD-dependent oxidoreductase [Erythrobacter sp. KY5]|uniref:FAD-dependent oxidoreductase n=1 Tax=Erythrobacter sp. KY5 TaxID=2011159 RepID=UPI0013A70445|nr:FAD-dependent oxidoreductase [Erythrobacter sp. KY5]